MSQANQYGTEILNDLVRGYEKNRKNWLNYTATGLITESAACAWPSKVYANKDPINWLFAIPDRDLNGLFSQNSRRKFSLELTQHNVDPWTAN